MSSLSAIIKLIYAIIISECLIVIPIRKTYIWIRLMHKGAKIESIRAKGLSERTNRLVEVLIKNDTKAFIIQAIIGLSLIAIDSMVLAKHVTTNELGVAVLKSIVPFIIVFNTVIRGKAFGDREYIFRTLTDILYCRLRLEYIKNNCGGVSNRDIIHVNTTLDKIHKATDGITSKEEYEASNIRDRIKALKIGLRDLGSNCDKK